MANPEILAQLKTEDFAYEDQRENQKPIEGKSFENLRRFLVYGAVVPVRSYTPDTKPDYSDKRIYYPSAKGTNLQNWERDLKVTYDYAFGEETLEEIGRRNGNLTKQAVQLMIKRAVKALHEGTEQASRDRFPLESFDFSKPRTLASRERYSKAKGGISLEIAGKLEQGATLPEIKNSYSSPRRAQTRHTLQAWGYQLQRERFPILSQFEGLANLDATDEEIQTLLDKIRNHSQYKVLKQAGLVVNLTTVASKAGLYICPNQIGFISESLRKELLPQTKVALKRKDKNGQERIGYYHIIAAIDEPNAIDILTADHSLDDLRINPVKQIAGPKDKLLPNTTNLQSEKFRTVGNLIGDITGSRWSGNHKRGIKTADIIKGSPIGIYQAVGYGICYRKDQEGELRHHLESRLRTLGITN